MTNSIDAAGNIAAPISNIHDNNDLIFSTRNVDDEKAASGRYAKASTYIDDATANNNSRIITRDGTREYIANDDYRPDDLLRIDGMEVTYEIAASLGLIDGRTLMSPSDDFLSDAENAPQVEQRDTRPEAAQLLEAQLEVALGDHAQDALANFGDDIVANGEISAAGLRFAQERLGMSEQSVHAIFEDMREVGGNVMSDFMEVGDGLGMERLSFLADKAERGTARERSIIRNLWFRAATGKLTRDEATDAFNYIYSPYED